MIKDRYGNKDSTLDSRFINTADLVDSLARSSCTWSTAKKKEKEMYQTSHNFEYKFSTAR